MTPRNHMKRYKNPEEVAITALKQAGYSAGAVATTLGRTRPGIYCKTYRMRKVN